MIIAVVIPCYKVKGSVLEVIKGIGTETQFIIVVDDACPEKTGSFVKTHCSDPRVIVITHEKNQGVGGAVITGYQAALAKQANIIVKVDGDGQIDPALIPTITAPILSGLVDYAKGNRFYSFADSKQMPTLRKLGNLALSFVSKFSSGYMSIFDPTNGFTAIHGNVAKILPFEHISRRYFFESDMLFHLGCLKAVVCDIPMRAIYQDEVSNLRISSSVLEFTWKNLRNFSKRILLNYFLRDFNIGSAQLICALPLIVWSLSFGCYAWIESISQNKFASAGTVMLAALPIILGMQMLLGFLNYDMHNTPKIPLHKLLPDNLETISHSKSKHDDLA